MDQSDIEYIMEILNDAISTKDWDLIYDANDCLKEFIDSKHKSTEDE